MSLFLYNLCLIYSFLNFLIVLISQFLNNSFPPIQTPPLKKAQFQPDDSLQKVYDHITSSGGQEFFPFVLMTPCPRKKFEGDEVRVTLREAGLHPRGVLIVQRLY